MVAFEIKDVCKLKKCLRIHRHQTQTLPDMLFRSFQLSELYVAGTRIQIGQPGRLVQRVLHCLVEKRNGLPLLACLAKKPSVVVIDLRITLGNAQRTLEITFG